jgi:hypothetical protein
MNHDNRIFLNGTNFMPSFMKVGFFGQKLRHTHRKVPVPKHHAMNAHKGSGVIVPCFLNFGSRGGRVVSFIHALALSTLGTRLLLSIWYLAWWALELV